MVNVWIFFRISGGLFNPAVTFAMLLTKAMPPVRFFLLLVAQLAGSIFASFLVSVMFPTPLNVRTTLSADTSVARGVFIEAVLTAELVFTIFMLAKEKHKGRWCGNSGYDGVVLMGLHSYFHRACGHWARAVCRRARRRVLYWWIAESGAQLWTLRRYWDFRPGALDLL